MSRSTEWSFDYEDLIANGNETFPLMPCTDEFSAIALSYTSGTTGNPKGVVGNYRGAYLNALGNLFDLGIPSASQIASSSLSSTAFNPSYLWIVPMFHCNGWCFVWSLGMSGTTSIFMRQIRAETLFHSIETHKVGFMCGAPITMLTMLSHPQRRKFDHPIKFLTAGAPPPPAVIKQFINETGVTVQTAYGLTEVYGPIASNLPIETDEEARLAQCTWLSANTVLGGNGFTVLDPTTLEPVPCDGVTMGEIMIRGNVVMQGYFNNEKATLETFITDKSEVQWMRTGDLGVLHPLGRVELKDRAKDIIISGGENISSIEVENTLIAHEHVSEAAVIAIPDDKWGEVPCAFIVLKEGGTVAEDDLIQWSWTQLPKFCCPKKVVIIAKLPKTSTGKIQKHELRKLL